jgi:hypothetical protein
MINMRTAVLATRHLRPLADAAARIIRILRALFQEVIGFTFFVLAAWGALWMVRTSRQFNGNGEALFKMVLVGGFVLAMLVCGVSSFRAARRISRGK